LGSTVGSLVGSLIGSRAVPWAAATLALVLGAVAVYLLAAPEPVESASVSQEYATDISFGPNSASVVLVEYADFQCGPCARFSPMIASLREQYGDRVLFVFRLFPLDNHSYGLVSARAAYAAHLQGRFWEMQELLFERQTEWSESEDPGPLFARYAESLGLDLEKFAADARSPATADFILAQKGEALEAGVDRTPYFLLNGSAVTPRNEGEFRALIEQALR
jgi:protein-disulfide isomerase